jgi:DNA replication initiation complex subunit (GINS family)
MATERPQQSRTAKVKETLAARASPPVPAPVAVNENGEEEIRTPTMALWQLGRKFKMEPKDVVAFAVVTIGKSAGFTHEDVALVELALKGVKG